jgi:uncharacterized protein involved in oxidation of intracellular sulfur
MNRAAFSLPSPARTRVANRCSAALIVDRHQCVGFIDFVDMKCMKVLFVINDPPYGTERVYNALRLAHALVKKDPAAQIMVFLLADAVVAGKAQQKTPEGYYNIERMLKRVIGSKGSVLLCGTCMDARGMNETELLEGAQRSTMDALANATAEADKALVF